MKLAEAQKKGGKKKVRFSFTTQFLFLFSGVLLRAFAGDKSFFCCLSCSSFLRGTIWQRLTFCNYFLLILVIIITRGGFPGGASVKNLSAITGDIRDTGSFPGWGRSPGGGYGNPLQHSCLDNPMDRKVWWARIHGITKSQTLLKQLSTYACITQGEGQLILPSCL